MSNYLRGTYVECLVADLLGVLPVGADWAPWDVEFASARIEVKQSAARQKLCEPSVHHLHVISIMMRHRY